jgi:hypothetical protein
MIDDAKTETEEGEPVDALGAAVELENDDGADAPERPLQNPVNSTSEMAASPAAELPKRASRGRKWLVLSIAVVAGVLVGLGLGAPDRQAAKDEAAQIRADAKREARTEAKSIVADAREVREGLLGEAEAKQAELLESIESGKVDLDEVRASIQTARDTLASTKRKQAQKQKQVDSLNRAIRASTSLSRQNAVAKARDYLDYDSFSCSGLIGQLEFEGYSSSDATYAAKQVGLC